MFDIGGLELFLILIIALLVIGPQRMPEVARQIGRFVAKTRRFIQSVKEESELRDTVESLRRELDLREEVQTLRQVEQDLQHDLYGNLRKMEDELKDDLDLNALQRPTFGGEEPPPLHMDVQDPQTHGIRNPAGKANDAHAASAKKPTQTTAVEHPAPAPQREKQPS